MTSEGPNVSKYVRKQFKQQTAVIVLNTDLVPVTSSKTPTALILISVRVIIPSPGEGGGCDILSNPRVGLSLIFFGKCPIEIQNVC